MVAAVFALHEGVEIRINNCPINLPQIKVGFPFERLSKIIVGLMWPLKLGPLGGKRIAKDLGNTPSRIVL